MSPVSCSLAIDKENDPNALPTDFIIDVNSLKRISVKSPKREFYFMYAGCLCRLSPINKFCTK